ncbi:GNAT family N-acetyltransferase [Microbacterium sp. APC 3898]|uniref:GNAT family N-acetyltransferase n=1 Tax=Planococcus notacanthi TaxID=3035188 RepID=A0ABT7ZM61_9BACL|nr:MULTISPECIES: GNAT family N-acetyltransferase [Terrabacteria group]MDN3428251.1 GNAT family N-acetyltransferase [Planococcus sp. APC 4016]MDN3498211.1 GNAT family N-acetyltransferase [Microbacterium sp. APC 3898]
MDWKTYYFEELTAKKLYEVLKLRVDVFVVEQNCPYPELDNLDQQSIHLLYSEDGVIQAYARLVPGGVKYDLPSIGRVIVRQEARGRGLAKQLLEHSINYILTEWKAPAIQLQGQVYLQEFYQSFGFQPISESYDEDGIPHVDMKLTDSKM